MANRASSGRASRASIGLLPILFFLSGFASLVYQVIWVRSLSLVFGGSHLAVTTVLSVFMGGLAMGGLLLGRRADALRQPLRLYAVLEIGIGLSAGAFQLLLRFFPDLYAPLARLAEGNHVWLTFVRVALASLGMIVPATLMGGTLPVLSRADAGRGAPAGRLGLLYAVNTLGAVIGTLAAGFFLLPRLGVLRSVGAAVAINLLVGGAAWLRAATATGRGARRHEADEGIVPAAEGAPFAARLVLPGIAISGFCALGYEVLWTRVLTLVIGTSVYSFTILLAAFLTGIAAGGQCEPLLARIAGRHAAPGRPWIALFGAAQILVGTSALAVTWALRDVPLFAVRLQEALRAGTGEFRAQQATAFLAAFAFLSIPAFFMGLSFPVAGRVHSVRSAHIGRAVGEVLTFNTIGAIAGAAASGFVLVHLLGFERSLHLLIAINVATGCAVLAGLAGPRVRGPAMGAVALTCVAASVAAVVFPDAGRAWDPKFLAVFRSNQSAAFRSTERIRDALANTDVLYSFEGANETISVIRPRGAHQGFIVNGRVEASTSHQDRQCQRTLGHLPMLAHPHPGKVFVLGAGTGMTLGAATLHPEPREIVLAEIEPGVLPATRTFAEWNHHALDDPRVRVVLDDGRGYLGTTTERFDVITADPIHPWSGGASSLYTDEYFRLASRRLAPGGLICQWLPLYELDVDDLRSVVRTFANNFPHVMLWITHDDAELLGSNAPIAFDRAALDGRIGRPSIQDDLEDVFMGSAEDFLAYFAAGTAGLLAFSGEGVLNTDDNLWLEFHAPLSRLRARLQGGNVAALTWHRESLPDQDPEPARLYDRAHALFLLGRADGADFTRAFGELRERFPGYAPGRFLAREVEEQGARQPVLRGEVEVALRRSDGTTSRILLSVVTLAIGPRRGVVMVVDNAVRETWGERYVDALDGGLEAALAGSAAATLAGIQADPGPRSASAWRERVETLLKQ